MDGAKMVAGSACPPASSASLSACWQASELLVSYRQGALTVVLDKGTGLVALAVVCGVIAGCICLGVECVWIGLAGMYLAGVCGVCAYCHSYAYVYTCQRPMDYAARPRKKGIYDIIPGGISLLQLAEYALRYFMMWYMLRDVALHFVHHPSAALRVRNSPVSLWYLSGICLLGRAHDALHAWTLAAKGPMTKHTGMCERKICTSSQHLTTATRVCAYCYVTPHV